MRVVIPPLLAIFALLAVLATAADVPRAGRGESADASPTTERNDPDAPASVPADVDADAPDAEPADDSVALVRDKLESRLAVVAETAATSGSDGAVAAADGLGLAVVGGRLRVVVEAADTDPASARAAVLAAGGAVEGEYAHLVQALVPPDALAAFAADPAVRYIRAPAQALPRAPGRP